MPITIEKARLNVWNIGAAFLGMSITAFGWGVTYATMTAQSEAAKTEIASVKTEIATIKNQQNNQISASQLRMKETDGNFAEIKIALPRMTDQIEDLSDELKTNKDQIALTNARIDRALEIFGGKLDTINDKVNRLVTSVEVIANKIGGTTPQPQKTNLKGS